MPKTPRANIRTKEAIENEAMMKDMLKNLLTADEAAQMMGTNDSRVRQLIAEGRLVAVKKGKEWIIAKPSVERYLTTKSRRGRPPSGIRQQTGHRTP